MNEWLVVGTGLAFIVLFATAALLYDRWWWNRYRRERFNQIFGKYGMDWDDKK